MTNTVVTAQLLDLFSLTLTHGAMGLHAAKSMSTIHEAYLPNDLHHHLCPSSGLSLSYFTENGVGNIFIHKLFSYHIPFSLTSQLPLLSCVILFYQSGSSAVSLYLSEHLTRQCGAEGARVWHSTCLSAHCSPTRLCSEARAQKSLSVPINVPLHQSRGRQRTSGNILIVCALC